MSEVLFPWTKLPPTHTVIGKCLGGSHAYGTNIETSDLDVRMISVKQRSDYLHQFVEVTDNHHVVNDDQDEQRIDIVTLVEGLCLCVPVYMEMVHLTDDIILDTPQYQLIRQTADQFITSVGVHRNFYASSSGLWYQIANKPVTDIEMTYDTVAILLTRLINIGAVPTQLISQLYSDPILKRLKLDRNEDDVNPLDVIAVSQHLLKHEDLVVTMRIPPEPKWFISDVDGPLTVEDIVDGNVQLVYESTIKHRAYAHANHRAFSDTGHVIYHNKIDPGVQIDTFTTVNIDVTRRRKLRRAWQLFQRDVTRWEQDLAVEYDTHAATQMIRLLMMGQEMMTDGRVIVKRPDAEFLTRIRRGEFSLKQLEEIKNGLTATFSNLIHTTPLPKQLNPQVAIDLITTVQDLTWE